MNDFRFLRKAHGVMLVDGKETAHSLQCGHCGAHCFITKGSGKKRGFCTRCGKFLCGAPSCMKICIPVDAKIEYARAVSENNQRAISKLAKKYPSIERVAL